MNQFLNKGAKMPISIFPLFLLLIGVATCYPRSFHDDDEVFQPMVSRSNERRICVELCMSGLGGEPCGDDCVDLSPLSIPIQYRPDGRTGENGEDNNKEKLNQVAARATPRNSTCPVLCANKLGNPLCNCQLYDDDGSEKHREKFQVDYVQICAQFCIDYDYRLFGCQKCDVYRQLLDEASDSDQKLLAGKYKVVPTTKKVLSLAMTPAWTKWCVDKCAIGEGGSACNCDKPVMAILG